MICNALCKYIFACKCAICDGPFSRVIRWPKAFKTSYKRILRFMNSIVICHQNKWNDTNDIHSSWKTLLHIWVRGGGVTSVCRARSWHRLASSACSPASSSSPRWGRPRPRCSPQGTAIWYLVTNVWACDSTHHIRCKLWKCWDQTLSLLSPKSIFYLSGNRQSFGLKVRSFGKFSEFILAMNN